MTFKTISGLHEDLPCCLHCDNIKYQHCTAAAKKSVIMPITNNLILITRCNGCMSYIKVSTCNNCLYHESGYNKFDCTCGVTCLDFSQYIISTYTNEEDL